MSATAASTSWERPRSAKVGPSPAADPADGTLAAAAGVATGAPAVEVESGAGVPAALAVRPEADGSTADEAEADGSTADSTCTVLSA